MAYGGSQARGQIRATAAGLRHSSQQCQNPLSKARDGTPNLMVPIESFPLRHDENSNSWNFFKSLIFFLHLRVGLEKEKFVFWEVKSGH